MVLIKLLEKGSSVSWKEMERLRRELREKEVHNEILRNEACVFTSRVGVWALTSLATHQARAALERTFGAWRRETAVSKKVETQMNLVEYMFEMVACPERRAIFAWVQAVRVSQRERLIAELSARQKLQEEFEQARVRFERNEVEKSAKDDANKRLKVEVERLEGD